MAKWMRHIDPDSPQRDIRMLASEAQATEVSGN